MGEAAIFVIAFFASAERKVVGKVLRNLNSLDSRGVVVLIFSNREKPFYYKHRQRLWDQRPCCVKSVYRCCQIRTSTSSKSSFKKYKSSCVFEITL